MKGIIAILFVILNQPAFGATITLNIPDTDIRVIETDVVDVEQWIRDALRGKLNKCRERLVQQELRRSLIEGSAIPSSESEIVDKALARPDYRSRRERERR